MNISLIHPSRSRPEKASATAAKWQTSTGGDFNNPIYVQYILSLDEDDPKLDDYFPAIGNVLVSKNKSAVDAINNAAKIATGDILIVMSDDFDCPHDWALQIINAIGDKKDWIIKTPDGIQEWIITLPIMDRDYYNRFGYIYHPDYLHMFCDTELTCVADLTGRKVVLNIPFVHNHYSTGNGVKDEVSIKADSTWDQGEKLFLSRAANNFDLVNPIGKIKSTEYISWMKSKGVSVQ